MARHKQSERRRIQEETRQQLLAAATAEFAREGYVGANVNRISRAAGFAKGTIYNYFPSKEALMNALIDDIAGTHVAFVVERVLHADGPASRLQRFFEAGFAFVSAHLAQALVMINILYGPHTAFKNHMYQAYQPLFQLLDREILAPGMAAGVFRQMDCASMAALLMSVYLGTSSTVGEEGRIWLDPAQVADFALRALRREAGPATPAQEVFS